MSNRSQRWVDAVEFLHDRMETDCDCRTDFPMDSFMCLGHETLAVLLGVSMNMPVIVVRDLIEDTYQNVIKKVEKKPVFVVADGLSPYHYKRIHRERFRRVGYQNRGVLTWCNTTYIDAHRFEDEDDAREFIQRQQRRQARICQRCIDQERQGKAA